MSLSEKLEFANILAFDIETTGLNPRKHQIIGFSLAGPDWSDYVVHQKWDGEKLVEVAPKQECIKILQQLHGKKIIGWNLAFDLPFTKNYFGVDLLPDMHCDVMLLKHTCDENPPHGLKETAMLVYGEEAGAEKRDLLDSIKQNGGSAKEFYKADADIMARYGKQDARLTYDLYEYYSKQAEVDGVTSFFYEEVMELYRWVTIPMQVNGIPVDVPFMQRTQTELAEHIENLHNFIQAAIEPYLTPFNRWYVENRYPFKASGHMLQYLGDKYAPKLWPKTDSGEYSTNKELLRKASELSKTELKKGSSRELMERNTYFEMCVMGYKRWNEQDKLDAQLYAMKQDGVQHPFNINSKDHLKRLLFGYGNTPSVLNEKAISFTDKGSPQVDEETLDKLAEKYTWAADLVTYNKLCKIKSTYVDRFLEEQEDGLFYPDFYQHRTVSGRFGSDIQQLPRPLEATPDNPVHPLVLEYTNRVRAFFIAPPGYTIIDDDYSSLEPTVFAHVSGDPALQDIFRSGKDFYSEVAIRTEKLTQYSSDKKASNYLGKLAKSKRQTAKAYALGLAYGMGPYALSKNINVSVQEAEILYKGYMQAFPKLAQWMQRTKAVVQDTHAIRTESGRLRRFPQIEKFHKTWNFVPKDDLDVWKEYEGTNMYPKVKEDYRWYKNCINNAYNVQIQGLAASIMNRASVSVAKRLQGFNARVLAQIHDELIVLCANEQVEEVSKIVQDCMENTYKISVPLIAEPSIGPNWRDAKK